MVKFLYHWGGSVLMVAAFLIGIPGSFSASKELVAWMSPLGMQPIHLAFWLLGIGAIYTTIIQGTRIKNLEENRPSIDVAIVKEDYTYYLKVHNKGEKGILKAQFELTSKEPSVGQLPYYNGHWRLTGSSEAEIMKGHSDMIKVAESVMSSNGSSIHLNIFFHDESAKSERYVATSSYWIGAYIESPYGSKKPVTKWDYCLKMSISSSPSLKGGVFVRSYRLNVDGLEVYDCVSS